MTEILISIALLAVVSLAVISIFTKLFATGGKQSNQAVARRLADRVLTRAVREGPPGWGTNGTHSGDALLKSQRDNPEVLFLYSVDLETMSTRDASVGELIRVHVTVEWWPGSQDSEGFRQGHGKLSVEADQIVYLGK